MLNSHHLSSAPSPQDQASAVLFALRAASPLASVRAPEMELEGRIADAIGAAIKDSPSPFNNAQQASLTVQEALQPFEKLLPQVPVGRQPYLCGVIYGCVGENLMQRQLPAELVIAECDRAGRDISAQVARAVLLVHNFLAGDDGKTSGSSVSAARDQDQAARCIYQLIAANLTSDNELFQGASHAAQALVDHFSRRGLLTSNERLMISLAGMIVSAFAPKVCAASERATEQTTGVPSDLSGAELTFPPADVSADAAPGRARGITNTAHLSQEQCRLLSRLLKAVVDHTENLDVDCAKRELGCSEETIALLGTDVADSWQSNRLNKLECVNAVIKLFSRLRSTAQLSADELELAASIMGFAKDAIVDDTCYDLPHGFLNGVSDCALRELVEDFIDEIDDALASPEDFEPLTAGNLNKRLNLVDCLDAMAFRLRTLAAQR